jgi:hypothetical protein
MHRQWFEALAALLAGRGEPFVLVVARYGEDASFYTELASGIEDQDMVLAVRALLDPQVPVGGRPFDKEDGRLADAVQWPLGSLAEAGASVVMAWWEPFGWVALANWAAADDVPLAHQLMDAVREIAVEWSNSCHKGSYVWQEPPPSAVPMPTA